MKLIMHENKYLQSLLEANLCIYMRIRRIVFYFLSKYLLYIAVILSNHKFEKHSCYYFSITSYCDVKMYSNHNVFANALFSQMDCIPPWMSDELACNQTLQNNTIRQFLDTHLRTKFITPLGILNIFVPGLKIYLLSPLGFSWVI